MKIQQVIVWELEDGLDEEVIWGEFKDYSPDSGVRMLTSESFVVD